jgi:hypothetical protein
MEAGKNRLKTPWKSRVAFVHHTIPDDIYLLVHPCGEMLIISNKDKGGGAARWDRACIHWIEERNEYWMCKYGVHDQKFSLSGLNKDQLTALSINFGIEFKPKDMPQIESPRMLDSLAARSLLNWKNKHVRMSKENETLLSYVDVIKSCDVLPLPDAEYTGY